MGATVQQSSSDRTTADLLVAWQGGRAKLWDFSPSLTTLTVRVESRERPGNLHIVCGQCEHIRGPFHWEDSALEVVSADGAGWILRDPAADFEIRCGAVGTRENVEPVYTSAVLSPFA